MTIFTQACILHIKEFTMRTFKAMPKHFYPLISELSRLETLFWASHKDIEGNVVRDDANYALLYSLLTEVGNTITEHTAKIGEVLINKYGDTSDWQVTIPEYGKKVVYDEVAKWLFLEQMSGDDFKVYDEECNRKFFEKKNKG